MIDRANAEMPNWTGRRARIALAASVATLAVILTPPALARPAQTTWTTYLRAGPGLEYSVIDEVAPRSAIDVQDCHDDWCRVVFGKAFGYIAAGLIANQDTATAQSAAPGAAPVPCFEIQREGYARQEDYGGGDKTRICGR